MGSETIRLRTADDVWEGEAGGLVHRAALLCDLASAAGAASEEFAYCDACGDLVEMCKRIEGEIERLRLDDQGGVAYAPEGER